MHMKGNLNELLRGLDHFLRMLPPYESVLVGMPVSDDQLLTIRLPAYGEDGLRLLPLRDTLMSQGLNLRRAIAAEVISKGWRKEVVEIPTATGSEEVKGDRDLPWLRRVLLSGANCALVIPICEEPKKWFLLIVGLKIDMKSVPNVIRDMANKLLRRRLSTNIEKSLFCSIVDYSVFLESRIPEAEVRRKECFEQQLEECSLFKFDPIVLLDPENPRIVWHEALIRDDPDALEAPTWLMEAANVWGPALEVRFDSHVLCEAVRQFIVWLENIGLEVEENLRLSINIHWSSVEPQDPLKEFVQTLRALPGIDPRKALKFELSHRRRLPDPKKLPGYTPDAAIKTGYVYLLDDYPMENSSFTARNCAFIKGLKVDKSVLGMKRTQRQRWLSDATRLKREKGGNLFIVSEGVQDFEQIEYLSQFSIDGVQGPLFDGEHGRKPGCPLMTLPKPLTEKMKNPLAQSL